MESYTVPSRNGDPAPLESYNSDHLSTLDIVWYNKFEGEMITPTQATRKESEFYKGAPPQWLIFHWAEQTGIPFVKRDLYKDLRSEIVNGKTKRLSLVKVDLDHEPGSGGSTLTMQVLWDLRKELKCAKVKDSKVDPSNVAKQVVRLFNTPDQNTVLLLLDNKETRSEPTFLHHLEDDLIREIKANNVTTPIPVVIVLNCLRHMNLEKTENPDSKKLRTSLSERERSSFEEHQADIIQRHGDQQFHAFNIMLDKSALSYTEEVCNLLQTLKTNKIPRNAELLAVLSLVNSYVPGSCIPHDLCQRFLQEGENPLDDFSLEQQMEPYSSVLVVFSTHEEEDKKKVRIKHCLIAKVCLEEFVKAGFTRSDIMKKLLEKFCTDEIPQDFLKTIQTLLMKRESIKRNGKDTFSRLILDMEQTQGRDQCISVLKLFSMKFNQDPYYPQALARYLQNTDYVEAITWAEITITRNEGDSRIRDTLGLVHKHHLKSLTKNQEQRNHPRMYAREILRVGKQAAKAFEDEEEAAKIQQESADTGSVSTSKLNLFNHRGLSGYMHMAHIIFKELCQIDQNWGMVLRKEESPYNILSRYQICSEYKSFISSLRDKVQEKFEFFEWYCIYSKPIIPQYIWNQVDQCHRNFVQKIGFKNPSEILREKKVGTFAGQLRFFPNRDVTDLKNIANLWKKIYSEGRSEVTAVNYVLSNIILSQIDTSKVLKPLQDLQALLLELWDSQERNRSPEFYLLLLLLFWPDDEQSQLSTQDLSRCVGFLEESYMNTYEKFLRKSSLLPLFFLGEGQGLKAIIKTRSLPKDLVEELVEGLNKVESLDLSRVQGEVRNCKVFAQRGPEQIEVSPQPPASICGEGKVSFYLGFNIKGPVAFDIRYEN